MESRSWLRGSKLSAFLSKMDGFTSHLSGQFLVHVIIHDLGGALRLDIGRLEEAELELNPEHSANGAVNNCW